MPITDANNRAIIIPTIEAVQEVKVQANTYDAEMARTGGGMFNTLMRSGANAYHGSAYGHLRRTGWDANSFFNNASGAPITDQPNDTWGGSFGGKIWIPKVYDGKNKTFFYLGLEHYDDTQSSSSVFATPTGLERTGDFSKSLNKDGSLRVIYNPLSVGTRVPFAGNIIPGSMLNPVGLALANSFQTATSTPRYFGDIDLSAPGRLPCRAVQYTGKIDEDFTSWWRSSLSYLRYYSLEPGNTEFPTLSSPNQWRLQRRVDTTQLNNLFTINPTTVLTVRYGFNRFPNYSYDVSQGFDLASLGFPSSLVNQVPRNLAQFPYITMSNFYTLGVNDNNSYYVHASNNLSASVAKYMGKHSLKIGFDYRRIKAAGNDANNAAAITHSTESSPDPTTRAKAAAAPISPTCCSAILPPETYTPQPSSRNSPTTTAPIFKTTFASRAS
jgi:trimeric autotransporter adhesin